MLGPGVFPAAITPFDDAGKVDLPAVARLLAWFKANGCAGAVLAGTNGEGPSLGAVEKRDLIRAAVPLFPELKIVLGIATPSLDEAVWLCAQAHKAGAAAGLVMAPYYFREATEDGIARWFEYLFDRTELPILVYNFPKRTGVTITPDLMERLGRHERMIGAKDSSGERSNLAGYAAALPGKDLYVGNETLLLDALDAGWSGTISGAANVLPNWLSQIVAEFGEGKRESLETKFALTLKGIEALRDSPQPAVNKAILHHLGVLPNPALRLPRLPPPEAETEQALSGLKGLIRLPLLSSQGSDQ
jgi:4-hydroxy-tetrahydrodipicolinate synthase